MTSTPRYDWGEIFAYYAALGPARTYRQVIERFGVGQRTVERRAVRDRWVERAAEIDAKAQAKAEAKVVRDRSERVADSLRIIDAARTRFAGQLGQSHFKLTGAEFVGLVKLEQLLEGEATDRVALGEVETLFAIAMQTVRTLVADALTEAGVNGKRNVVLAYFDRELPQRVAELTQGTED